MNDDTRYFRVEGKVYFELWEGGHSHISPIDTNGAKSFSERYGKVTVAE